MYNVRNTCKYVYKKSSPINFVKFLALLPQFLAIATAVAMWADVLKLGITAHTAEVDAEVTNAIQYTPRSFYIKTQRVVVKRMGS